jgi:type II secretory pathway pseudopilin PulG
MSNERGLTIIEAMAALSLLAISAAVIGQFLVQNTRFLGSNQRHTVAYALAEGELEDLRSAEYDDLESRTREEHDGNRTYAITTKVTSNSPGPDMKKIAVDVAWDQPGGKQHVTVYSVYTAVKR